MDVAASINYIVIAALLMGKIIPSLIDISNLIYESSFKDNIILKFALTRTIKIISIAAITSLKN